MFLVRLILLYTLNTLHSVTILLFFNETEVRNEAAANIHTLEWKQSLCKIKNPFDMWVVCESEIRELGLLSSLFQRLHTIC